MMLVLKLTTFVPDRATSNDTEISIDDDDDGRQGRAINTIVREEVGNLRKKCGCG